MVFNPITFPGLGLGPFDPNPTAFSILERDIQWYGIIIAVGFLLAAVYGTMRSKVVGLNADLISDALIFCVPAAIIGARVYYVLFNLSAFKDDPIRVFYIWEGGVAIYGSVIFALATAFIFTRVRKVSFRALADLAALGFLIGQSIGRWGNFMNREVFGVPTDLPWRMELYSWEAQARVQVHPAFLYESLWNAVGFIALHFLLSRRKYNGQVFLCYIAWYGLGRGIIEGLRADTLFLFNTGLRVSQVLAYVSCAAAVALLTYFHFKGSKKVNVE